MTLDETRFKAAKESGETYCASFHRLGREHTAEIAKGVIDASSGALCHLIGEAAAYAHVQRIADEIASRLIDQGNQSSGV